MSRKELEQFCYLNGEIKMWQEELERIRQRQENGQLLPEEEKIRCIIKGILWKVQCQRENTVEYINKIQDSRMRTIVFLRVVAGMSWKRIAAELGGGNTAENTRAAYNRYLKKMCLSDSKK